MVLTELQTSATPGTSEVQNSSNTEETRRAEYRVSWGTQPIFWLDSDDNYKWDLSVITELCADNSLKDHYISYFIRASKGSTNWNYSEDVEIRKTLNRLLGEILLFHTIGML